MRILIARWPEQASWLNFPYFYGKARRELSAFAEVEERVIGDTERPMSENFDLAPYDGIISFGGKFTDACVAKAGRLKCVVGFWFGEEVLKAHGVPYLTLDAGWTRSVAELGMALTLSALRAVGPWHAKIQAGHETWPMEQFSDNPYLLNGELYGKRVGLFGFGRIGQYYAKLARAFGAELAAYDPYVGDAAFAAAGVKRMELDELLAWSQIFTIASAPTPESERMIDRRRLALLPVGSALIVLSRSWPLDMQAVRDRIANSEICGAFDVYDVEPLPPNDVLRRSPNVTLTPHIAGRCADSNRLMAEMAVAELKKRLL